MTVEAKRIPPIHQRKREIALLLELCCAVIMGHRPKNACVTRLFAKPLKGAHYIRPETKPFAAIILLISLLMATRRKTPTNTAGAAGTVYSSLAPARTLWGGPAILLGFLET